MFTFFFISFIADMPRCHLACSHIANHARGELNRKNKYFPGPRARLRIWSYETGSAVPSRVSLLILHTQAEPGDDSRDSSRFPKWRPFIFTANRHRVTVPILSGHTIAYRWRSLPRVCRFMASSPRGSPGTGAAFSGIIMDQSVCASIFLYIPTISVRRYTTGETSAIYW